MDLLDANGIEVNVRYLPFCLFPEKYRKFVQNFQQITYDLHEWEAAGEAWSGAKAQRETEAALSEHVDFFRHIEALRLGRFSQELAETSAEERWGASVSSTLDVLESQVAAFMRPVTVALYGSAAVGSALIQAAAARPLLRSSVTFTAYISSAAYRTASTLNGLPWETPEWL